MTNSYNITNAQILDFINKRLYEIQNHLGNINIDISKNKINKKIAKIGSYVLFLIAACFFVSAFLGPEGLDKILFSNLIIALIIAVLGGASLGTSQFFDLKGDKATKQQASFNSEATILQQVREYLNGKLAVTKEIQDSLDSIKNQIYNSEQAQYNDNTEQTVASVDAPNSLKPQTVQTPSMEQGTNIMEFVKKEYSRLKSEETAEDSYYFISEIDNGKYNTDYTPEVLKELRNLAVKDIAQSFYQNLVITYSLTPDIIISNVRRGIYNNKHINEVLAEVINIANHYKNNENIGK